jgi:site-specific DNA recombinase
LSRNPASKSFRTTLSFRTRLHFPNRGHSASTYKGERKFNPHGLETKEAKPEADQIGVAVDPIIDAVTFDAVQAALKAKNQKATPPRVVTGPFLLTGIATCACCSGGMALRTGRSGR